MKTFIKITALILAVVLCSFAFVSCGDSKSDALKGKWERDDDFYGKLFVEFDGNGKFTWGYNTDGYTYNDKGTYTIEGETVKVSTEQWDEDKTYNFTVSDSALILKCVDEYLGGAVEGEYTLAK